MQDQQESFPSLVFGRSVVFESNTTRVAEVGSQTKPFVKGAFANFSDTNTTKSVCLQIFATKT